MVLNYPKSQINVLLLHEHEEYLIQEFLKEHKNKYHNLNLQDLLCSNEMSPPQTLAKQQYLILYVHLLSLHLPKCLLNVRLYCVHKDVKYRKQAIQRTELDQHLNQPNHRLHQPQLANLEQQPKHLHHLYMFFHYVGYFMMHGRKNMMSL